MNTKMIHFQRHGDERGQLVVLENIKDIPFVPKRIYYVFGVDSDKNRGKHAHKRVKQLFIAINGSVNVLLDDGIEKKKVCLNSPFEGLYFGEYVWSELCDFSNNAIFLVIASDLYDENEYIRNYQSFIEMIEIIKGEDDGN